MPVDNEPWCPVPVNALQSLLQPLVLLTACGEAIHIIGTVACQPNSSGNTWNLCFVVQVLVCVRRWSSW